jgi:asparagine synthase (glutamine-hydrolysing)
MCGVVGAVDLEGRRLFAPNRLAAMVKALSHRGPDDEGSYVEPGIALSTRRLALVDPAGGRQPMSDEAGRVVVAVNGELFDHAAERARLEALGARFRTRSDTEVWTRALAIQGERYLASARGQFAVAIWFAADRRLVLARDRFGICPLYTARAGGWLLFASEIKAILASGLVEPRIDPRMVDHVFACLCASPVRSAFIDIAPVPPGHQLVASEGSEPRLSRFASIDFPARGEERRAKSERDLEALIDELGRKLERAVKLRLAADAPVATYLSGGVDSSLIAAMAGRAAGGDITAFSVRLDNVGHDESELAAATARTLGVSYVAVPMGADDLIRLFPDVVRAAEVPILDHADACLLALSRSVREHGFKAALTGEGADESFAGYPWVSLLHRLPPVGGWLARSLGAILGLAVGGAGAALQSHGAIGRSGAGRLYGITSRVRASLFSPSMWERLGGATPFDDHRWDEARIAAWDPLNASLFADFELVLGGHLLLDKGDRVAMASGIEPRFPFLDEDVVAFAASIEPSLKLRGLTDKWILRRLAERYLPADVAARRKHMFRASPVVHAAGRPRWVEELLSPESLRKTALFDPDGVRRALAGRTRGDSSPRGSLLEAGLSGVVSTQLLHHLFFGGGLCELPVWSPPPL